MSEFDEVYEDEEGEYSEQDQRFQAAFSFATDQYRRGNLDLAIDGYRQSIALKPEVGLPYAMLAVVIAGKAGQGLSDGPEVQAQFEEAMRLTDTALAYDADDAIVQESAGDVCSGYANFHHNAIDDPLESIVRPIGPAFVLMAVSAILLASGWWTRRRYATSPGHMLARRAESHYLRALELDPEDATIHQSIATLYSDMEEFFPDARAKVRHHLGEAIRLDPDDPTITGTLSWLEYTKGSMARARTYALETLAADANEPQALASMANYLMSAKGDFVGGREHSLRLLDMQHDSLHAQMFLNYSNLGLMPFMRVPMLVFLRIKRVLKWMTEIHPALPLGSLLVALALGEAWWRYGLLPDSPHAALWVRYTLPVLVSLYGLAEYAFLIYVGKNTVEEIELKDF